MLDIIQDDSQILELSALVETFQLRQLATVQDTGANDVDSQVGDAVYNRSIGYHARRDIIAWTQGRCPEITEDEVNLSLAHLSQEGYLVRMGNDYAITETRYAEDQAARLTAELTRHNAPPSEIDVAAAMTLAEEGLGFALSPGQSAAVRGAMTHRASIITGGPGTGKTTVLRALCDAFEAYSNESIQLLAPTGKAARRLSEQTGRPTMTVHALLRSLEQETLAWELDLW